MTLILDNTGDARGLNAIDLQRQRTATDQVAGADYSLVAGENNKVGFPPFGILATHSVAIGLGNVVQSSKCFAFGEGNTIKAMDGCVALGINNSITASGASYAMAFGKDCESGDKGTIAMGEDCRAVSNNTIAFGKHAHTKDHSEFVFSQFRNSISGDMQWSRVLNGLKSTDATPRKLTYDGLGDLVPALLSSLSAYSYMINVAAHELGGTGRGAWQISALVSVDGSANVTIDSQSTIFSHVTNPWSIELDASVLGQLAVKATGEAGKTILWMASLESVQLFGI